MIKTNQTMSRQERIDALVGIGARKCDAIAVIDADELAGLGMQAETFAFSMQMRRLDKLQSAIQTLKSNLKKKGNS
jgi:hypothetical protein